jgi:tetratricopeptide (TPR) repeat protein
MRCVRPACIELQRFEVGTPIFNSALRPSCPSHHTCSIIRRVNAPDLPAWLNDELAGLKKQLAGMSGEQRLALMDTRLETADKDSLLVPFLHSLRAGALLDCMRLEEAEAALDHSDAELARLGLKPDPVNLRRRGVAAAFRGDYANERAFYQRALDLGLELGLPVDLDLLINLGAATSGMQDFEGALVHFFSALRISRERQEEPHPVLLENIGVAYKDLGEYELALDYYEQARLGFEARGIEAPIRLLTNMATARQNLGLLEQALEEYDALIARHGPEPSFDLGILLSERANLERRLYRHQASLMSIRQAMDVYAAINYDFSPTDYVVYAMTLWEMDHLHEALDMVSNAVAAYSRRGIKLPRIVADLLSDWKQQVGFVRSIGEEQAGRLKKPAGPIRTIFCYRRPEGQGQALLLQSQLRWRGIESGDVQLSYVGMEDAEQSILAALAEADALVLILNKGFFDPCIGNAHDSARLLIRLAKESGLPVHAVLLPDFEWPDSQSLPPDIAFASELDGLPFEHDLSFLVAERLADRIAERANKHSVG